MHELKRRTYLESLGIDSYISRGQLPGAARTKRLVVVRRPAVSQAAEIIIADRPGVAAPAAKAPESIPAAVAAVQDKIQVQAPAPAPAQAFSVAAIAAGGWLWVEELSNGIITRDQLQLIRGIVRALGLKEDNLDVSQFDWPIHTNKQLDLGEGAAQAGLGGFVQRKLDQLQCRGLILLGSACQQKLDKKLPAAGHCVSTVSTAEMLRDGQLKKQAWLDLLPLANRT